MITADLERARSALFFLSADMPRDDWVEIAMAIEAELGEGGFDRLPEVWTSSQPSYWEIWAICPVSGARVTRR